MFSGWIGDMSRPCHCLLIARGDCSTPKCDPTEKRPCGLAVLAHHELSACQNCQQNRGGRGRPLRRSPAKARRSEVSAWDGCSVCEVSVKARAPDVLRIHLMPGEAMQAITFKIC
jgi:hypothetical protein